MITDILFNSFQVFFSIGPGPLGTQILSYSMDGNNYDFEQTINYIASGETSHVFVT
jgi:hypothetical protein